MPATAPNPEPATSRAAWTIDARLTPFARADALTERVARRGGRCFRADGTLVVTLPDDGTASDGALHVLVPRGFGHPLLARAAGAGRPWRAEGSGAPCLPSRWVSAGRVAAYVREASVPSGPARAESRAAPVLAADGPWLCLRWSALALAAARLSDPTLRRGPVAVAGRSVIAASSTARARGVTRGMPTARAVRRCPDLRVVAPVACDALQDALVALLEAEVGAVRGMGRGRVCVRLADTDRAPAAAFARAERVLRRLYQAYGARAAAVVADRPEHAAAFSEALTENHVGVLVGALPDVRTEDASWWGIRADRAPCIRVRSCARDVTVGSHAAAWRGSLMPDVEGSAVVCGALAADVDAPALAFAARTERGAVRWTVRVPHGADRALRASVAESAARRALAFAGAVSSLRCTPAARPTERLAAAG